MRGALCLTILLILLPIGQSALSSQPALGSQVAVHSDVKIVEALVRFPSEHVGIANLGEIDVNLTGWSISDGEGSWTFKGGPILAPKGELFIGPNLTFLALVHPEGQQASPEEMTKKGRLVLADEGDEVLLVDQVGDLVDVLTYGKSSYSGLGWSGEKVAAPPEGKALRREGESPHSDSDTKNDWAVGTLGRSILIPVEAGSMVEPFLCPDQMRYMLLREISFAHSSVSIEVYILSDPALASALVSASSRGVRIRILVEGEPVGGLTESQSSILQALRQSGCEVYLSCGFHGFKRFDYLHPKFMVVDGRRALLASENFAPTSLEGNRGWGVSVESQRVAGAFLEVFEHDVDPRYPDIKALEMDPSFSAPGLEGQFIVSGGGVPEAMRADIETVLAPDFGYPAILSLIDGARSRLYLELYYMTDQWRPGLDPYQSILSAARRGVSVRLILDGNWYNNEEGKGNSALAERMNSVALHEGLDLRAKTLSPFHGIDTLHNKGAIADDKALVCSINWVRASFERNREAGVVIDSAQVAAYFAQAFEEDWVDDAVAPELIVPSSVQLVEGQQLVLNASTSDNSGSVRVTWDVGCDGSVQGEGLFFVARLPPGETVIGVTAFDSSNNSRFQVVRVMVTPRQQEAALPYAIAGTLAAGAAIWGVRKRVKRA